MEEYYFIIFIVVLIVILLFLWIFYGGKDHKFEGLNNNVNGNNNNLNSNNNNNSTESEYIDIIVESDDNVCANVQDKTETNSEGNTESTEICILELPEHSHTSGNEKICVVEPDVSNSGIGNFGARFADRIDQQKPRSADAESSVPGFVPLVIPSVRVKLPSLDVKFYENYSLNKNKTTKMANQERRTASESRGEKICRSILEKFYEKPFPSVRPDFLVNPETGFNLELDCYNEELGIALEYNGAQHYVFPNKFHKTEEEHEAQKRRDEAKKEACNNSGVYLISVPYHIPHGKLPMFIEYNLPENVEYRQKHGIEGKYTDEFWDEKEPNMSKHGFV